MGIPITAGFDVKSPVHLDRRQAMTKAEMLNLPKGILPPYFFIQCLDDGQLYIYDESIEPGPTGSFILATNMNGTEARKSIPSTGEYSDGAIIQYVGETTGKWKKGRMYEYTHKDSVVHFNMAMATDTTYAMHINRSGTDYVFPVIVFIENPNMTCPYHDANIIKPGYKIKITDLQYPIYETPMTQYTARYFKQIVNLFAAKATEDPTYPGSYLPDMFWTGHTNWKYAVGPDGSDPPTLITELYKNTSQAPARSRVVFDGTVSGATCMSDDPNKGCVWNLTLSDGSKCTLQWFYNEGSWTRINCLFPSLYPDGVFVDYGGTIDKWDEVIMNDSASGGGYTKIVYEIPPDTTGYEQGEVIQYVGEDDTSVWPYAYKSAFYTAVGNTWEQSYPIRNYVRCVTYMPPSSYNGDFVQYVGISYLSYLKGHFYEYSTAQGKWIEVMASQDNQVEVNVERRVGTWEDGSPIYQKTFKLHDTDMPDLESTKQIWPFGYDNCDVKEVLDIRIRHRSDYGGFITYAFDNASNGLESIFCSCFTDWNSDRAAYDYFCYIQIRSLGAGMYENDETSIWYMTLQYIKAGEAGTGNANGAQNSDGRSDGTEDPTTNYTGPKHLEGDVIFGCNGTNNSHQPDSGNDTPNNSNSNANGWTPNYGNDIYSEDDPEPEEDDGRVANDWVPDLPSDNDDDEPVSNEWTPDLDPEDDDGRVANDWVPDLPSQEDMNNIVDVGEQIANEWTPDPEPEEDSRVANEWVPNFD